MNQRQARAFSRRNACAWLSRGRSACRSFCAVSAKNASAPRAIPRCCVRHMRKPPPAQSVSPDEIFATLSRDVFTNMMNIGHPAAFRVRARAFELRQRDGGYARGRFQRLQRIVARRFRIGRARTRGDRLAAPMVRASGNRRRPFRQRRLHGEPYGDRRRAAREAERSHRRRRCLLQRSDAFLRRSRVACRGISPGADSQDYFRCAVPIAARRTRAAHRRGSRGRACVRSPSSRMRARRTRAQSTRCPKSPRFRKRTICGCTSTEPTARQRHSAIAAGLCSKDSN